MKNKVEQFKFSNLKIEGKFLVLLTLVLAFVPLVVENRYILNLMVFVFLFAAMGVAWNVIGGYGAQISWCHASFYAMGAYTSFILYLRFNISPFISVWLGMIAAMVIAVIIGLPSFKLRGAYFTISTIAFGEILRLLLIYFSKLTGGAEGLVIAFRGANPINLQFYTEVPYYYITLVLLGIIIFLTWKLEGSRLGYYLKAIKEDEDAALSLGIRVHHIKLMAFMISAAMMAVMGTVASFNMAFIDPLSAAGRDLSIKIGVIAIVGGIGKLWGPVLGAFLIVPLIEITNLLLGSKGGASTALYGLILILIVIFKPEGIIALYADIKSKVTKQRNKAKKQNNIAKG